MTAWNEPYDSLVRAIDDKDLNSVTSFLNTHKTINLNQIDNNRSYSLLGLCLDHGSPEILLLLLKNGMSSNPPPINRGVLNQYPLHMCVRLSFNNDDQIDPLKKCRFLLEYGCDVEKWSGIFWNFTPLEFALVNNKQEFVDLFVEFGASYDLLAIETHIAGTSASCERKTTSAQRYQMLKRAVSKIQRAINYTLAKGARDRKTDPKNESQLKKLPKEVVSTLAKMTRKSHIYFPPWNEKVYEGPQWEFP